MIIDTHAHLTDEQLSERLDELLGLAREASVEGVLTVGTTLETSRKAIELAERFPQVCAAVGIHPNDCCQAAVDDWGAIGDLAHHPRVVALGETGLDRYWDDCPWEVQVDYFHRHLALSVETSLPVVIHTRDCAEETLDVLREAAAASSPTAGGPLLGVMHSYTGPWEVARGCLDLGLYVSFAGMLTFKNAGELREVAARIPLDRVLVETDSPYLTPHPHRGKKPNHPAMVAHTLRCLAEVHGITFAEMARRTTENARRLFSAW
jgi:TatD DNase family protein